MRFWPAMHRRKDALPSGGQSRNAEVGMQKRNAEVGMQKRNAEVGMRNVELKLRKCRNS